MTAFGKLQKARAFLCPLAVLFITAAAIAQPAPSEPNAVPRMQAVPLPYHQVSFQRDGVELTRYHFGPDLRRPFLFPVIGPSGCSLTRMGHPHDPESHSHHNSVWVSHNDVNGVSFWSDTGGGKIRHKRVIKLEDGDELASILTENHWLTNEGKVLLSEIRKITVMTLKDSEWLLIIDLQFEPKKESVTLGKTPFGMLGVRMAKTIGVNDGGGKIRNSAGKVNEKEVLWKRTSWVDYSGPITSKSMEGITLFDYPGNWGFPTYVHVRNDGWMGVSLTHDAPWEITSDKHLRLRYALYIHRGMKPKQDIEGIWRRFTQIRSKKNLLENE